MKLKIGDSEEVDVQVETTIVCHKCSGVDGGYSKEVLDYAKCAECGNIVPAGKFLFCDSEEVEVPVEIESAPVGKIPKPSRTDLICPAEGSLERAGAGSISDDSEDWQWNSRVK